MGKYYQHQKTTKSGYLICAVPLCCTKKSTTTLKTFEFPSDLKRRNQWISAIVDATLQIEEETLPPEDLYALENRRMELEMEVSSILGDHSYVCARHFRPEDIVMYPNVCRLSASAIPSVFKNFPMNLPPQFFKKICQTVVAIDSLKSPVGCDTAVVPFCEVVIDEARAPDPLDDCAQRQLISILSSPSSGPLSEDDDEAMARSHSSLSESESDEDADADRTKQFASAVSGMSKVKMRKRLRTLELRYRRMRKKAEELEAKLERYNIGTLERDAAEQNEEAAFLLDMLRTYTEFEKTRKTILSNETKS